MAGTVHGKIECFSSPVTGTPYVEACQEAFKNLYDFMVYLETQNYVTIRARYDGVGATAPATDYWDGVAPFRAGAFFLVEWRTASTTPANPSYVGTRTYPFYMLFQFFSQATTQTPPQGPLFIRGANSSTNTAGVTSALAVGYGGDLNPWNGTLGTFGNPASFGTQAKAAPVWRVPASGGTEVHVLPRSNNAVGPAVGVGIGAHATDKQNTSEIVYIGNTPTAIRYHYLADQDGFLSLVDYANNHLYNMSYSGVYIPRPSLPITTNLVQFQGVLPYTGIYGAVAGTGLTNGGILTSSGVQGVTLYRHDELYSVAFQPNRMFSTPTYDELVPTIGSNESNRGAYMGYIDLFREVFNTGNGDTNTGGTRAVFGGSAVAATVKTIVPWNAGTVPFSGLTRAGVSF